MLVSSYQKNVLEVIIVKREFDDIINGTETSSKIEKFGITHYRYEDCELSQLVKVDGFRIRKDCAEAFKEMKKSAKRDGIRIKVVSGYRSSHYQIQVFRRKFKDRKGDYVYPTDEQMKARLTYSAPSGYSEHHTGLAVDINETEDWFKDSPAYEWLLKNASRFGFELSFPENNAQGLGFEPWHWRYIGLKGENKQIFADARRNDKRFK